METQNKVNVAIFVAILTTWAFVGVSGVEPTHYCESRELTAHCMDLSSSGMTCYTLPSKTGGKRCSEGWKEIPIIPKTPDIPPNNIVSNAQQYKCSPERCEAI